MDLTILEIRRFLCPYNQEKELSLVYWKTNIKKYEFRILGLGGKGEFFFSFWPPLSSFLSFFIFDRKL